MPTNQSMQLLKQWSMNLLLTLLNQWSKYSAAHPLAEKAIAMLP
jgi:hypothetical protein